MPTLTPQLLDAWTTAMEAAGCPHANDWQPGLDGTRISELEAAAGVKLPPELAVWWSWRNGRTSANRLPRGLSLWPLETALKKTARFRQSLLEDKEELQMPDLWLDSPRWLWIGGYLNGDMVFANLEAAADGASAVRIGYVEDLYNTEVPAVPSLGTLVTWWTEAVQQGQYWWDDEAEAWEEAPHLPTDRRTTGLV